MKKKVLLLGASGMIAPNLLPGLEDTYDMTLADIAPHPDGKPIVHCDVSSRGAGAGCSRGHGCDYEFYGRAQPSRAELSRQHTGALNAMQAAAEHGIKR